MTRVWPETDRHSQMEVTMKKTVVAAAGLAAATAVTGAAVLPGPATAGTTVHTKRLVLHQTGSHRIGQFAFAGTDVARHAGNVVGYDAITGHFYPRQNRA